MRFSFKSGSFAAGLGLVGAGIQFLAPPQKWLAAIGWIFIACGLIAFAFDMHVEQRRIVVGGGQSTLGGHLRNAARRLKANWFSLTLIVVAVIVLSLALSRQVGGAQPQSPQAAQRSSPLPGPSPTTKAPVPSQVERPAAKSTAPTDAPRSVPADTRAPKSTPAPGAKPMDITGPTTHPEPMPTAEPSPTSSPTSPTPSQIRALAMRAQLNRIRDHRNAADAIFNQLNTADTTVKLQAALAAANAWDRRASDLVGDVWGAEALTYYRTANIQSETYFHPDYSKRLPADQFYARKDWMNRVRQRQFNLGELAIQHARD